MFLHCWWIDIKVAGSHRVIHAGMNVHSKSANYVYILPIGETAHLRLFLKSRNLKNFAMSPNTHSAPTLALLMAVLYRACCGFNWGLLNGFVIVVVVNKRGSVKQNWFPFQLIESCCKSGTIAESASIPLSWRLPSTGP